MVLLTRSPSLIQVGWIPHKRSLLKAMIQRLNIQKWFRSDALSEEWYDDLQVYIARK